MVKKNVASKNPTSFEDLVKQIKLVWVQEISAGYCNDLVESIPRRIAAVLAAKGNHNKY